MKPRKKALSGHLVSMETANSTSMTYPADVFDDRCPTRMMPDRLADKWALLVLDRLDGGPVSFNRLRATSVAFPW